MVLSKLSNTVLRLSQALRGKVIRFVGLDREEEEKSVTNNMNEPLNRADSELLRKLYVKKVRLDRRIADFNRSHNIKK